MLSSFTGSAAPGFTGTEGGVKARLALANANGEVAGHKLTYILADDQSTTQGAQAAMSKLILQDHVSAVIQESSFFYGAYQVAVKAKVPVFGSSFDACPCWGNKDYTNLFDVNGTGDYSLVPTTMGTLAKTLGVTKFGGLSYEGSPSSILFLKEWIASAQAAGLQTGYSSRVPFGSTDTGPFVLGVKNSGTDGIYLPVIASTAFAVLSAVQQQGMKLKASLLGTGYGADLLDNKTALQTAQGAYIALSTEPIELKSAGTVKMMDALNKYVNQPIDVAPSFSMGQAWLATDALVWALVNAKSDLSPANIISVNRAGKWDAAGLMHPLDFSSYGQLAGNLGPDNCLWVVQVSGSKFVPVDGLSPVCGTIIAGQKVSN